MYRATLETERDAVENALFSNINTSRARKPVGYPAATAAANEYVARLNAQYPDKRIGPSLVLKVMAGDTVQIGAQAFYKSQAPPKNDNPAPDMLSPLLRAFGFPSQQASGKIAAGVAADATPFNSGFASRFSRIKNRQPEKQGALRPKAYLNYVLFNEQMEMVDDNSGAKQVKEEADKVQTLANDKMTMRSNGYLYVYTSNESYQDVYFDDVTVLLLPGPLLEETHYYPFGLTMTGISTRAAGRMENRHRFGSKELQSMELANGNGLDWYDYDARIYDPQIGRWLNQDPHAEKYSELSPYNFVNNNPLIYVDPTGKDLAIYFEQDANGNWTIRITATYYVKKGDADSKASATDAAEYWNNKSGEYVYRTGSKKKNNEQDYVINFDIKVVEVDDPAAQKRHDMAGDDKALTKDGSSNTYEVVRDSDLNEHGKTSGFMYVKVRKSDMYGQTGPHEIGHSLLMDHSPNSLMNDGQSGDMNLWPSSVQETLEKTIKESDHQSQFDKPGNRFTIHGNLPRGGKVRNNPNHVEK
jgi:RHS repeat-associated protein